MLAHRLAEQLRTIDAEPLSPVLDSFGLLVWHAEGQHCHTNSVPCMTAPWAVGSVRFAIDQARGVTRTRMPLGRPGRMPPNWTIGSSFTGCRANWRRT